MAGDGKVPDPQRSSPGRMCIRIMTQGVLGQNDKTRGYRNCEEYNGCIIQLPLSTWRSSSLDIYLLALARRTMELAAKVSLDRDLEGIWTRLVGFGREAVSPRH